VVDPGNSAGEPRIVRLGAKNEFLHERNDGPRRLPQQVSKSHVS